MTVISGRRKEWGQLEQHGQDVAYQEAKPAVKDTQKRKWLQHHPDFNCNDSIKLPTLQRRRGHDGAPMTALNYQLSREEEVMIVRLRTGHCKLRHHMYTTFHIGDTDIGPAVQSQ